MMNTNEECFMETQRFFADFDERSDVVKLLYDWISQLFNRLPIPERLFIEDIFRTLRGAFQLITFCGSENCNYQGVLVGDHRNFKRLFTISDVGRILSQCGSYLKELSLSEFCNSSIMPIVGEYCKNLTKLEFVFDKTLQVNDTNHYSPYTEALTQLNKLVSIKIQVITSKDDGYSTNFPIEIIDCLPEGINGIHLFFKSHQRQPLFFNLEKFKHLYSLTIRGCNLDNIIKDILKKSTLTYLDIRDSWVKKESWVFDGLVNLEHIDLPTNFSKIHEHRYMNELISSDVVTSIFDTCKHLKYFEIPTEGWDNEEPSLDNWVHLGNLVHFCIWWEITDDFATKMVKYCKKLKYLDCKNVCGAAGIKKLTELENLECLKFHDLLDFSAETIIAISNNCKKLKRLEIPRSHIPKRALTALAVQPFNFPYILDEISKLQYLEYLDLSRFNIHNSVLLEDNTIILIAKKCKYLKYLNIGGSMKASFFGENNLTENAFNALTCLENLIELVVDYNNGVTNNFVKKLKGLKFFSCVGCSELTGSADGIIQLIKNCPDLEQLALGYHMSSKTLKKIITGADLATENRINGIILYIRLVHQVLDDFSYKRDIKSQWLVFVDRQDVTY